MIRKRETHSKFDWRDSAYIVTVSFVFEGDDSQEKTIEIWNETL